MMNNEELGVMPLNLLTDSTYNGSTRMGYRRCRHHEMNECKEFMPSIVPSGMKFVIPLIGGKEREVFYDRSQSTA